MKLKNLVALTAAIVLCISLIGCGISRDGLIEKTSSNLKEMESVNVVISVNTKEVSGNVTLTVNQTETGRLTKVDGTLNGSSVITYMQRNSDFVTFYSTNRDTGKWETFEQNMSPISLSAFLDAHQEEMTLNEEKQPVGEVECYALQGKLSAEEMNALFGEILSGIKAQETNYTIFIDTKSRVNKIEIRGIENPDFAIDITFYNWDDTEELIIPEKAKNTTNIANTSPFRTIEWESSAIQFPR